MKDEQLEAREPAPPFRVGDRVAWTDFGTVFRGVVTQVTAEEVCVTDDEGEDWGGAAPETFQKLASPPETRAP